LVMSPTFTITRSLRKERPASILKALHRPAESNEGKKPRSLEKSLCESLRYSRRIARKSLQRSSQR
jgi:hypothetical protein